MKDPHWINGDDAALGIDDEDDIEDDVDWLHDEVMEEWILEDN
jgi:hypothetical protein